MAGNYVSVVKQDLPESFLLTDAEAEMWYDIIFRLIRVGIELEFRLRGSDETWPNYKIDSFIDQVFYHKTSEQEHPDLDSIEVTDCFNKKACNADPNPKYCATLKKVQQGIVPEILCLYSKTSRKSDCIGCQSWRANCVASCVGYNGAFSVNRPPPNAKIIGNPDPDSARLILSKVLHPSGVDERSGKYGISKVAIDHSLGDNGVEIVLAGSMPIWRRTITNIRRAVDAARAVGAYVDERCSVHYHTLMAYDPKRYPLEDDRIVPDAIIANYISLLALFEIPMMWMSATLPMPYFTRWSKFRNSFKVLGDLFPCDKDINTSVLKLCRLGVLPNGNNNRYLTTNFARTRIHDKRITSIHSESRIPDGSMSPTAIAALSYIPAALMMKAAKVSSRGLLKFSYKEEINTIHEILFQKENSPFLTGKLTRVAHITKDQLSFMRGILPEYCDILLGVIEKELQDLGCPVSVLRSLAETPISLRRYDLESTEEWLTIENDLRKAATRESAERIKKDIISMRDDILDINYTEEEHSA